MSPRVVLITGCSSGGIGYTPCEAFAAQGCKVYASSRKVESIRDFKDPTVEKLAVDVNSDESVANALAHIVENEGKFDVVVNNAGLISPGPIVEVPVETVKQVFETNTFAILRVCKAVTPIMAKHRSGTIVNIHRIHRRRNCDPMERYLLCLASKAAVNSISEVLFMELKPLGISVLHVAPQHRKQRHFALCPAGGYFIRGVSAGHHAPHPYKPRR